MIYQRGGGKERAERALRSAECLRTAVGVKGGNGSDFFDTRF